MPKGSAARRIVVDPAPTARFVEASEVRGGEAVGLDGVVDDRIRDVADALACRAQPGGELGVLGGAGGSRTEALVEEPDARKGAPFDEHVGADQRRRLGNRRPVVTVRDRVPALDRGDEEGIGGRRRRHAIVPWAAPTCARAKNPSTATANRDRARRRRRRSSARPASRGWRVESAALSADRYLEAADGRMRQRRRGDRSAVPSVEPLSAITAAGAPARRRSSRRRSTGIRAVAGRDDDGEARGHQWAAAPPCLLPRSTSRRRERRRSAAPHERRRRRRARAPSGGGDPGSRSVSVMRAGGALLRMRGAATASRIEAEIENPRVSAALRR